MEVKKGYKKTEIGVIPEDWEVKFIIDITDVDPDNLSTSTNPEYFFNYISLEDVDYGVLRNTTSIKFKNAPSRARRKVAKNDVLISTVRPNLKSHLHINEEVENLVCSTGFAVLRCNKNIVDSNFIFNHFFAFIINNQIDNLITGSNYPAISNKEVKSLKIPLPPLPEQTAIATVLSDPDSLIQALEKKIAKKELIKKGAMQELLKPKEGWEEILMPEVCWFQEGPGVRNSQFTNSGVKLLNGTNIEKGKLLLEKTDRYISNEEAFGWYSHFLVDDGDILIACSGVSIEKFHEKVTFAESKHLPLCMNTSTMRFKIKSSNLVKDFLFHFLKSYSFKEQIGGKATGSAQLNFGPSHVSKVYINMPSIEEQTNIAQILSDMDTEIETLEKKLSKYKQLKQGLMQELLTGRIRLV